MKTKYFALGFYVAGAIATFLVIGFFVGLGGNDADLWKPFVYAILWPVMVPLILLGRAG